MDLRNWCQLGVLATLTIGAAHRDSKAQDCNVPRCSSPYVPPCVPPPVVGAPAQPAESAPAQPAVAAPAVFSAPPPSGQISGESNSIGMQGLGIHFPEFTLQFPTIQLPSMVRYRRNPEMQIDRSRAPMVAGAPALYAPLATSAQAAAPQSAPAAPQPKSAPARSAPAVECVPPPPAPPCGEARLDAGLIEELRQARRELSAYRLELERMKQSLQAIATTSQDQQLPLTGKCANPGVASVAAQQSENCNAPDIVGAAAGSASGVTRVTTLSTPEDELALMSPPSMPADQAPGKATYVQSTDVDNPQTPPQPRRTFMSRVRSLFGRGN
jgi:hypothetical protein